MALKFNPQILDRVLDQLGTLTQHTGPANREEVRSLLSAALSAALGRMNLVTREEFDAQAALLARTREKLEQLEAALSALEAADS